MMFNLEFLTQVLHHVIVQVGTIVSNNLARNTISTDDVVLDELNHRLLGYIGIRCSFDVTPQLLFYYFWLILICLVYFLYENVELCEY